MENGPLLQDGQHISFDFLTFPSIEHTCWVMYLLDVIYSKSADLRDIRR